MDLQSVINQLTLYKVIHLKINMMRRIILKKIIGVLYLPEKAIERIILNFIGMEQFDESFYNTCIE